MYQPANLRLPLLALGLTLLLGTAACKKDKDTTPDDTEVRANAEDQATAENDDAIVYEAVERDAPAEADMSNPLSADSTASSLRLRTGGGCATRTWNPATRTLTIDFGTTNCRCADDRYRRGTIQATFTGPRFHPGSKVVITRQNYFVNDNQHLGTKTITFTNYNQWHASMVGGQIIFSSANGGGEKTWSAERDITRTASAGVPTTFTVTGSAQGTNRRGVSFTAQIQQPLIKQREYGCAGVFVDGTVLFTRSNGKTALLNYNPFNVQPPPCDRLASITVNEVTRNITLR